MREGRRWRYWRLAKKTKGGVATTAKRPARDIPFDQVGLTEAAAEQILSLLAAESKINGFLRIGIVGGGCSGLSYHFSLEETSRANDHIFHGFGAQICVDPKSLKILGGSLLDWRDALQRRGFSLINPKTGKTCSCGESFSL